MPLPEPLTRRELDALSDDERRAYWTALYAAWSRPTYLQREHQADHNDAIANDDWVLQ